MNFQSLVEFNQYTLALAAGAFVYALEKFVPAESAAARILLFVLLGILFASAFCGVLIFAAATAGQHAQAANNQEQVKRIEGYLKLFGKAHAGLLMTGLLVLGGMICKQIVNPPPERATCHCVCAAKPG